MKTPEQIAALYAEQFRYETDPRGGEVYPEIRKAIHEAIEADRAQRPAGLEDTERIVFFWSRKQGDCRDCGNPAAFIAPYIYGPERREDAIFCALCAANHAADGEPVERIEASA